MTNLNQFQVGETYVTRRIGDHTMTVEVTVEKRTACFATITNKWGETRRVKIQTDPIEWMRPEGDHSMCPIINASDLVPKDTTTT